MRDTGPCLARVPAAPRGRGVRRCRRLRRRGGRLPRPHRAAPASRTPDARAREDSATCRTARTRTSAAAVYRETTHRAGSLADASQLQGADAHLQRPARPRRCVPHRGRLHGRHLLPSSSRPIRSASHLPRPWPMRTGGRSRPTRSTPSARRSAVNRVLDEATAERHRCQRLRGGRGARLSTTRLGPSWPRSRNWPC